ncbi:MAG: orotidine-5'-phosphate decarboxylase [Alphaproteobacteria bacterium]|nr:orotidine-5'-phosphate decarboxylase [Alphaproteobacteria bacterium]
MTSRVFCAIDTADMEQALNLVKRLSGASLHFKLGLEFFNANGLDGVEKIRAAISDKSEIFLDLKLHDIPNTVAGAVRSIIKVRPQFLTVHASGGRAMIKAASKAAGSGAGRTKILAVTVMTSLNQEDLASVGQTGSVEEQVLRLAHLARDSGADGVICSPHEIEVLRRDMGDDFLLVVPGIRPAGSAQNDQKRTMLPEKAFKRGADYLVIGRPITESTDPVAAAKSILDA